LTLWQMAFVLATLCYQLCVIDHDCHSRVLPSESLSERRSTSSLWSWECADHYPVSKWFLCLAYRRTSDDAWKLCQKVDVLLLNTICWRVAAVLACSSHEEAPLIAFVSKMFPVDVNSLPQNRTRYSSCDELSAVAQ